MVSLQLCRGQRRDLDHRPQPRPWIPLCLRDRVTDRSLPPDLSSVPVDPRHPGQGKDALCAGVDCPVGRGPSVLVSVAESFYATLKNENNQHYL